MPPKVRKLKDVTTSNGKSKSISARTKLLESSVERLTGSVQNVVGFIGNLQQPNNAIDLKEFKKVVGSDGIFHGTEEPIEAEKWLMNMKAEFDALLVAEEDRVRFVTYMFRDDARNWWNSVKRRENVTSMSWEQFERSFFDKYFPPTARSLKCAEFATLEQGDMTVTQLDKKFSELECYGPHLVATEELRARKLEDTLRPSIRGRIVVLGLQTYAAVLDAALRVEADWIKTQKEKEGLNKKKKMRERDRGPRPNSSPQQKRPRDDNATRRGKGTECFRCGEDGHYARDCPLPAEPKQENVNHVQPRNQNTQRQNFNEKQHHHPRGNTAPFQPRHQPNAPVTVQGKLNFIAETKEETEKNPVVEEYERRLAQ